MSETALTGTTLNGRDARATPAPAAPAALARLRPAERQWLAEIGAGQAPALVLRSGTTVDVGQWFRSGRVWVACLPGRVALFARGRTPYRELIEVARLDQSFYNFLTGELALAPAVPTVRRVQLTPVEAQQVLRHITGKEPSHA